MSTPLPVWYIRAEGQEFVAKTLYEAYPNLFIMSIQHGERFTELPRRKYVDGLDIRLRLLASDSYFAEMLQYAHTHKIIYVYVEHDKSVMDPTLNVDEVEPSNEAENEDGGKGEDYKADYRSESEKNADEYEDENEGETKEEDEDEDEEDNHIHDIVDEEHIVDEVYVKMNGFRFEVEGENADPMQPKLNMTETDLEVLDFDSFESDVDDDKESARRKGLRKLKKEAGNSILKSVHVPVKMTKEMIKNRDNEILDEGKNLKGNTKEKAKDPVSHEPIKAIKAIQEQMQKKFHVAVSKTKAFRAKAKAQSYLRGDVKVKYSLLRDYVQELKRCNPNTSVKIDVYATNSQTQAGVTAIGSQGTSATPSASQAGGNIVGSHVLDAIVRRTKTSASRLTPTRNTT
nr:transposase, mutator type [Tanacetum cinerariifolium]